MTTPPSLPPRGWYPDPGGSSSWRWWDGSAWTDDLEPYGRPQIGAQAPLVSREAEAAARLVPVGLVAIGASVVLGAVIRSFEASYYAALWHWFHHAYDLASQGSSSAVIGNPPAAPAWASTITVLIVLPLEVLGLVLTLAFQHRAATAAKAVGLPQRLSPTFGVVGWFIPFAGMVLPWIAWRDLLPPTHPERPKVTAIWLLALGSGLTTVLSVILTASSITLAALFAAVSVIAAILALRQAPGVVHAVLEAHRSSTQAPTTEERGLPGTT